MDKKLICAECGKEFILTQKEQEYFLGKGYVLPKRCLDCRNIRRLEREQLQKEEERKLAALEAQWKWEQEERTLKDILAKLPFPNIEISQLRVPDSERSLVILGNGFDIMHGVKSSYYDFQKTIGKNHRLRWAIENYLKCENLWYNFEESLAYLDVGSMLDMTDMWLDDFNAYSPDAQAADYYAAIDTAMEPIQVLLNDLPKRFRNWVETLTCDGKKPLEKLIQPQALYLNFNYTDFLEQIYQVPHQQITYIHGCRKREKGKPKEKLILGHIPDVDYFRGYKPNRQLIPRYKSKRKAYLLESAMDLASANWVTAYEEEFTKKSSDMIAKHTSFFNKAESLEDIYVIGHSLSPVDYPYFMEIVRKNQGRAKWHIGYHGVNDMQRLITFVDKMEIKNVEVFKT